MEPPITDTPVSEHALYNLPQAMAPNEVTVELAENQPCTSGCFLIQTVDRPHAPNWFTLQKILTCITNKLESLPQFNKGFKYWKSEICEKVTCTV